MLNSKSAGRTKTLFAPLARHAFVTTGKLCGKSSSIHCWSAERLASWICGLKPRMGVHCSAIVCASCSASAQFGSSGRKSVSRTKADAVLAKGAWIMDIVAFGNG